MKEEKIAEEGKGIGVVDQESKKSVCKKFTRKNFYFVFVFCDLSVYKVPVFEKENTCKNFLGG